MVLRAGRLCPAHPHSSNDLDPAPGLPETLSGPPGVSQGLSFPPSNEVEVWPLKVPLASSSVLRISSGAYSEFSQQEDPQTATWPPFRGLDGGFYFQRGGRSRGLQRGVRWALLPTRGSREASTPTSHRRTDHTPSSSLTPSLPVLLQRTEISSTPGWSREKPIKGDPDIAGEAAPRAR